MDEPKWDRFFWDDGTLWDGGLVSPWVEEPEAPGVWVEESE